MGLRSRQDIDAETSKKATEQKNASHEAT